MAIQENRLKKSITIGIGELQSTKAAQDTTKTGKKKALSVSTEKIEMLATSLTAQTTQKSGAGAMKTKNGKQVNPHKKGSRKRPLSSLSLTLDRLRFC